jgi:N-acetylmuramoyl-L-alanine amidase
MLFLLTLLAGLLPGTPAWAADIAGNAERIVIRFDGQVKAASAMVLDGPRRIAVDVTGARPGASKIAAGLVGAVREVRAGAGSRIEIDLTEMAIIADGQLDGDGRALTLNLRAADAGAFRAASMAGPLDFLPFNLSFDRPRYKLSRPVPPAAKRLPLPRVRGDDTRPLVVIDAGHGGVDPGAINPITGLREKDVTLQIARQIRDALLASGRVRVALTREDDKYLVLRERYGVARRLKADLFISVHCDSTGSENATGASVYTLSEVASDKEAARLAARENKADVIGGINLGDAGADVSSILIDLTQRETMNHSAGFARLLGREAQGLVPLKPSFHRMASLMVLKAPDLPSVLFETGYISNPQDAAFLASSQGRERIAESVRRAVDVHFARRMAAR